MEIAVAIGAVLGGFVQGLSGFAFGLIALAVWAWVLPPMVAGPLVVFGSLVGQLMALPQVRLNSLPRAWPFVLGGLLGVPLGIWLLPLIDARLFKGGLGLLMVLWCPAMLLSGALPQLRFGGRWADAAAGGLGGVMGGLGGLTGPAPTLWCTLRGWDRHETRGVFQVFNLVMHSATMTGYLLTGAITAEAARLFVIVVPAMVLPALLGARLYARVSDRQFRRLVLGLLTASGAVLLVSALA